LWGFYRYGDLKISANLLRERVKELLHFCQFTEREREREREEFKRETERDLLVLLLKVLGFSETCKIQSRTGQWRP
jgi:hypothetical protein